MHDTIKVDDLTPNEQPCPHGFYLSDEFCPECMAECHGCDLISLKSAMRSHVDPVMGTVEWFFCADHCEANWNSGQEDPAND